MQIVARVPSEELTSSPPAWLAHVRGTLPVSVRAPDLRDLDRAASRTGVAVGFLDDLLGEVPGYLRAAWKPLRAPGALAVVAGQQPGCAGGILLTWYKAATAVSLARHAARQLGRDVVPVFWNAADDTDFDEIARVAWPDSQRGLLHLELSSEARRAAGFVGDLPAAGDDAAARAALDLLDADSRQRLSPLVPEHAADHADWVARLLHATFPDLAILDGRSPALRRHGAALFARYLTRRDAARDAVLGAAVEIERAGFARALSPETDWLGLFVTDGGHRRKTEADAEPLRRALETAPETLSPNVLLRPLLQDSLLPTLAHVVGPSEVGYLLELRPLRALLDVAEPALWPRLSLTVLSPEGWDAVRRQGLEPAALLRNPDASLRAAARARGGARREALAQVFSRFESELGGLVAAGMGPSWERLARRLAGLEAELQEKVEDVVRRELLDSEPGLRALAACVRPRDQPQERVVAALWLLARWGRDAGERLVTLADSHVEALQARRAEHALVTW